MVTAGYSLRIVDLNFFADPGSIMGHKGLHLTLAGAAVEKLIHQEDVVLKAVDKTTFNKRRVELLGN